MAVTLIQGGESILADRAIGEIVNASEGAVVSTLTAGELEIGIITDSLAPSLFGDQRVVVIKEIQDLSIELADEIASYLENQDEMVHLVLWHKGGVKGKALLDKVKKIATQTIAAEVIKKDAEKTDFVREEFARYKRKATPGAIQALVDALGSDMRELSGAVSQLAADVIGDASITEENVAAFQQGRVETTGYDVADAALSGKISQSLIALRRALESGVDPVLIVSALASSIRAMAKVSGVARGAKSFELAGELGMAPWQIDKARRQLSGWTPQTLGAAVTALAQCDADIKGAAADPIYALERTVLAIARWHSGE